MRVYDLDWRAGRWLGTLQENHVLPQLSLVDGARDGAGAVGLASQAQAGAALTNHHRRKNFEPPGIIVGLLVTQIPREPFSGSAFLL